MKRNNEITIVNGKTEFKSMKQYIEYFGLEKYVSHMKTGFKQLGYGKLFEDVVVTRLRYAGANIQKTGPEYDLIKGADIKMLFDDASILVDIKLNKDKAMHSNRYYLNDFLEFSYKKEDMFYYPLAYGIEVGFAFRNIRRSDVGYCVLKKPVLVAIFNFTVDLDPHKLFTVKAAKQFARYVELINLELIRQKNYPVRDSNSFYFTFYDK